MKKEMENQKSLSILMIQQKNNARVLSKNIFRKYENKTKNISWSSPFFVKDYRIMTLG